MELSQQLGRKLHLLNVNVDCSRCRNPQMDRRLEWCIVLHQVLAIVCIDSVLLLSW